MKKPLPSVRKVLAALIRSEGKLSEAALALHCKVQTISKIIDENPDILEELQTCHNSLYEEALDSAKELLEMRDRSMTKFVLEALGEKRGFTTKKRVEISGDKDNPVAIENKIDLSGLTEEELLKITELTEKIGANKEIDE